MVPVLFIAYHFPPVGGAGVQRSHKLFGYLTNEGFLPIVVTGPGPAGDRWSPRESGSNTQFGPEIQVLRAAGPIPQTNGRWAGKLNRWLAKSDGFSEWWIRAAGEAADRSV